MRIVLTIQLLFFVVFLKAQDVHFSQFNTSKFTLNPALTGIQEDDFQLHAQRKSQWRSVSDPFKTFSFSFYAKEYVFKKSIGLNFINDIAGASNFKTTGLNISISQNIIQENSTLLAIGGLMGGFQRTLEYSSLIFIEEEPIVDESIFFLDFALGALYQRKINNMFFLESGVSIYHLNNPNQSFSSNITHKTPLKFNTHIIYTHLITDKLQSRYLGFLSKQSSSQELIYGMDINYQINNSSKQDIRGMMGVYYRNKDAIIPNIGLVVNQFSFVMSYDVNVSALSRASNNLGGFELSLAYQWSKIKKKSKNKFICPKYL
jgi:type IX secretion system PorP/SprF family membrane protein